MIVIRIIISLCISAICIFFATKNVQWAELKTIISQIQYLPLVLGFLISTLTFWLRAFRWQILLSPFQKIPNFQLLKWQVGGLLINNLLPFRIGEFVRAYWTGHKTSIPKSSVFATIVMERLLDILSLAVIAFFLILYLGFNRFNITIPKELMIAIGIIFLFLFIFTIFFLPNMNIKTWVNPLLKILPQKISEMILRFAEGLSIFKNKKEILKVILLSPLIWIVDIGIIAILSRCVQLNLSWIEAGLLSVGLILGVMIPAAPGAAGTYEAGGVTALGLIGISKTLALSFVLILHSYQFLIILALGIPVLISEGFSLKQFIQKKPLE